MRLTLAEADKLTIQNNPQFTSAKYNAAAAYQVPAEYRSNLAPTITSSITGKPRVTPQRCGQVREKP